MARQSADHFTGADSGDKLPAFFYRMSPLNQRRYLESNAVAQVPIIPDETVRAVVDDLLFAAQGGTLAEVNRAAQNLIIVLCQRLRVAPLKLEIRGVRPRDRRRELHGIFYPTARPPKMVVWIKTAVRNDRVRPRTFFRTLMHEFGHYLDYALFKFGDSFHNQGFFKRESWLVRTLYPAVDDSPGGPLDKSV